jgi:ABC-2 type transport system permease protein
MSSQSTPTLERLRIVLAIAAKDLVEAIKNKNTLAVILPVLFIVLVYRYLPSITHRDDSARVFVYDPSESSFGARMGESPFLNVYFSSSVERMKLGVSESDYPELGLILPPDVDEELAAGSSLQLQGYIVHWVRDDQARELELLVEEELTALADQPVEIEVDHESIYPVVESSGLSMLMGLSLTFTAVMLGVSFLPHLMLEEKINRTMDVLMVSPARPFELALGKALVGMAYAMVIGVIGIAIYGNLITQWGVALVLYFAGALFMISVGLLLGSLLENRQQLMLWAWVILIPFLIPTFLVIMRGLIPDAAIEIMRWIPSVVLSRSLSAATVEVVAISDYLIELIILLAGSMIMLGLVAWVLKRQDRS